MEVWYVTLLFEFLHNFFFKAHVKRFDISGLEIQKGKCICVSKTSYYIEYLNNLRFYFLNLRTVNNNEHMSSGLDTPLSKSVLESCSSITFSFFS